MKYTFSLILLLLTTFTISAQSIDEGKALFRNNCASCHNKNMKDKMTGPALGGVQERWDGREDVLYDWIRNSTAVIESGDSYAVNLFNEYNKSVMTAFPNLTDEQITSILDYVQCTYDGSCAPKAAITADNNGGGGASSASLGQYATPILFALFFILVLLAVALARLIGNWNHISQKQAGETPDAIPTVKDILTNKTIIGIFVFAAVIFGGYTTVNNAINLGRQQGYKPDQPIKFSHVTHAGEQKIDCQYCHDGARRSKHSVIPATNTCMNCHKAVKKGSKYGTAEISKIYASIGFDPNTDKYIENYDNMTNEEIKPIFVKYAKDNFIADNSAAPKYADNTTKLERDAAKEAEKQWEGIKSSLTNPTKNKVQGAVEWIRIHYLPDHVYFSHKQHVTAGKIECQQCHGPVEKMEVVQQYAPLSMGWCINCHRQTNVQFADNKYYEQYELYHKELKKGDRTSVTVEDIGGLECQKCHY